jgi:hypothetical protein
MITAPLIGMGDVQRAALLQIFDSLNSVALEVNQAYAADDEFTATRLSREYVPVTIEPVTNENFYEGHHPSLIEAAIDRYPCCSAWAMRATPAAGSAASDHTTIYNDLLYVEVIAKAIEGETMVNLRIQRMAEAVNICLMKDPTLGGRVSGLLSDPTIILSDVQIRREKVRYGDSWYWQAARLEYAVRKDASQPPSSPGQLFSGGLPYDIDQA